MEETLPDGTNETTHRPGEPMERGALLGRYVILERLGAGAMGIVYAAFDPELDRRVAIKVLHPTIWGPMQSSGRQRLLREARSLAKLAHPNVVAVHDVGTHGDHLFVAMEFVEGSTMTKWLREEDRPWREVLGMYLAAGRGLAAAHAAGLVHRDFKPDNVVVGRDGRVRVLDFGLARAIAEDAPSQVSMRMPSDALSTDSAWSRSGGVVGTPAYMAPEQHFGVAAEAPADQFSFCVACWEGLHGERPFAGDTGPAIAYSVTEGRIREVRESAVPGWVRDVLRRGLAVDIDARWPSVDALLHQLQRDPGAVRRRWVTRGGFALAIGLVGWGIAQAGESQDDVCSGAEAKLAGVWDEPRREQVQTALLATGAGYAEGVAVRVRSMLDAYAPGWAPAHVDACQATNIRREQSAEMLDQRMACLGEQRNELAAVVDVLASADASVLEQAVRAVDQLANVDHCADPRWLAARVKPPDDPQLAERVDVLVAQLATPRALFTAGQFAAAKEAVEPILAEAREISYAPLRANAAALQASITQRMGAHDEAEALYLEAIEAAEVGGDDLVRARAWTLLVALYGYARAAPEQAAVAAQVATGVIGRLGDQPEHVAALESTKGIIAQVGGRYDEALASYERARDIWRRVSGPDSLNALIVQSNIVGVLAKLYRYEEAVALASELIATYEEILGERHPFTIRALTALATVHRAMGQNETARREHEEGVALTEAALGKNHPDLAVALHNLGSVNYELGRDADAEQAYRRAIEIKEQVYGRSHPSLAVTFSNLGDVLVREQRFEEALGYFDRALEMYQTTLGPSHPTVADALVGLAATHLGLGSAQLAIEHGRRAVELREATPGDPAVLADAKFHLARALHEGSRERAEARELAQQALSSYRELGERGSRPAEEIDRWLATTRP